MQNIDNYTNLIVAVLSEIEYEMGRLYWNKNQKELVSPFQNTGESYENKTFQVHAYNWAGDDSEPNFHWKGGISIFWYKHYRRGTQVKSTRPLTLDIVNDMLNDCINSMRNDIK